jgi:hypothetical protein
MDYLDGLKSNALLYLKSHHKLQKFTTQGSGQLFIPINNITSLSSKKIVFSSQENMNNIKQQIQMVQVNPSLGHAAYLKKLKKEGVYYG